MISIHNLSKSHRGTPAISNVTLTAGPGRVTGFLGPNGAGKSSTLRILLGLDRADAGVATINGVAYRDLPSPLATVGALLDGSGAHRGRTARGHLTWVARSNGIPLTRVAEVLELVSLDTVAKKRIGTFSLGMGQRLGLATALLGDPSVLVLDEPVNGLDPDGIRWIRTFLKGYAAEGNTVLLSSHLMGEMAETADDLVVIHQGSIISTGTVAEITTGYSTLEDAFFALTGAAR